MQGVGRALATFLNKYMSSIKNLCVDFDDLVAQFIRMHREDKSGHPFYIYPTNTDKKEDYNYHVTLNRPTFRDRDDPTFKCISVQVNNSDDMSIDEFMKMCGEDTGILAIYLDPLP